MCPPYCSFFALAGWFDWLLSHLMSGRDKSWGNKKRPPPWSVPHIPTQMLWIRHRKDIYQRIFISYPISKNLQKGYFLSFFGAGCFESILGISKYHIHILSYILFSTFSARDIGFKRPYFSFSTAISSISAMSCHFLAVQLIDQGFNSIW
jgi:hypothetical protein